MGHYLSEMEIDEAETDSQRERRELSVWCDENGFYFCGDMGILMIKDGWGCLGCGCKILNPRLHRNVCTYTGD